MDNTKKHKKALSTVPALSTDDLVAPAVNPAAKAELEPTKPIHIDPRGTFFLNRHVTMDNKDMTLKFDELTSLMTPDFEGKESEHNWIRRERNLIIMRQITHGNGPKDFASTYVALIRSNLDGILRCISSLRTSLSGHGCNLVLEAVRATGPGLDPAVDIIMPTLIKLCGHTKKMNQSSANAAIATIFSNVTHKTALLQYVVNASTDKNTAPRGFAQGWLKIIITRHLNHKHSLEHGNGFELMEKIVSRGLADTDPAVREQARATYWTFHSLWPIRAESIMTKLKPAAQSQLLQHELNPNPGTVRTQSTDPAKSRTLSRAAATASRSSLREVMAAKKKEKAKLDSQPAQPKESIQQKESAQHKAAASTGTLSSAPLRPMRSKPALKKAEGAKLPAVVQRPKAATPKPTTTTTVQPTRDVAPTTIKADSPPQPKVQHTIEHDHVELEQPLPKAAIASVDTENGRSRKEIRQHLSELSDSRTNSGNNASDSYILALIESGIKRIRSNTLDAHGYRKFQSTISSNINYIDDKTLADLVSAILPKLGDEISPSDDRVVLQQNILLRNLFHGKRKAFYPYVPDVVRNLTFAMGRYGDKSHIATVLKNGLQMYNQDCEMPSMDVLSALAALSNEQDADWAGRFRCLELMTDIIAQHQVIFEQANILLTDVLREVVTAMCSPDSAVRRQSNNLAAAAYKYGEDKKKFWTIFDSFSRADKTMLLYTIECQGKC